MKDEIKEILQLIGNSCYCGEISEDKCEKYCNYITNLQEENKKQKEILDKIKEHITTRTPSDIGISGNKPKKYYTLNEDEVDYILKLLEETK